jgi:HEPN domain-containing protein
MRISKLDLSDKVSYWFDLSAYDLQTAKVMLEGERYLYVGFMCHQVAEKALKGIITSVSPDQPPYTHNLTILAKFAGIHKLLNEDQLDLLDTLEPLNIQARYPTSKEKLLESLTKERCRVIYKETERLFEWLKSML